MQTRRSEWSETLERPAAPGAFSHGRATLFRSVLKRGRVRARKAVVDQLTYVLAGKVRVSGPGRAFHAGPGEVFGLSVGESCDLLALQDAVLLEFAVGVGQLAEDTDLDGTSRGPDGRLSRALKAFEARCSEPWTVARLAREAGMSRSAFAALFQDTMRVSPLEYLTRWRLQRVHDALSGTAQPFARIAADHGYRSRSACSHAFRRAFGYTPQDLRAGNRNTSLGQPRDGVRLVDG